MSLFKRIYIEEKGVTLIEYALIAALLTLVVVGVVQILGLQLVDFFSELSSELKQAGAG